MQIAATHSNVDFDALASLVAATFLYPGTVGLIPRQIQPSPKQFLSLHREIFHLMPAKECVLNKVSSLLIVDTNNWRRLEDGTKLREMNIPQIILWDHHMKGTDVDAHVSYQREMGSTITLMLQEMMRRGTAFTPMHATLFMLGLYDDTGSLTYPMTRSEDAMSASYLLENGADLNIVNSFLTDSFDALQQKLLSQMMDSAETLNIRGIRVGLTQVFLESSVNMLSQVVVKFRELSGLDACIGIFSYYDKSFVIGRSILPDFDAGSIIRHIGGGGHPGAASAVVSDIEPDRLYGVLKELIENINIESITVGSLMCLPDISVSPAMKIEEAVSLFIENSSCRCLVVFDRDEFKGIVDREQIERADKNGKGRLPIKTLLRVNMPIVAPSQSLREAALLLMDGDYGALPVFEGGSFKGIVIRNDIMLHLYEL